MLENYQTLNISETFSAHNIQYAIICSGSRSAPLTLSFVRNSKIKSLFVFDERSAGFIALGIAQRLKKPVVLICTSGTAALNFAPAVTESFYQQIPLLVLTADRPKEWIGQRDGQAIMQEGIFHPNILKSYSLQVSDNHPDNQWYINRILNEAILKSNANESGPVHINFGFREPFYPNVATIPSLQNPIIHQFETHKSIKKSELGALVNLLSQYPKRLLVIGHLLPNAAFNAELDTFVELNNLPVLADINSNCQSISNAINHADLIISTSSENVISALKPELLITFGRELVSKNVKNFLKENKPSVHIHIQDKDEIVDTFQTITHVLFISPETFVNQIKIKPPSDKNYLNFWKQKEIETTKKVSEFAVSNPNTELALIDSIVSRIPEKSILHTANSLSVRYLNLISSPKTLNYCNRGTSGIDGCTSTALGSATACNEITTLITGDVAFFYDSNAFWNDFIPNNLRVILVNNNGGAIFRSVEGANKQPELENFFVGKNNRNAENLAIEFGLDYTLFTAKNPTAEELTQFFAPSKLAKIIEINIEGMQSSEIFVKLRKYVAHHHQFENPIPTK